MTKLLHLQLDGSPLEFEVRRVLVAGYTGRDSLQVRAHIAELERQGIPAPDRVPTLYPIDASWATLDREIAVGAARVSGEAEPALLLRGENLDDALVSVIVDFTDREEERRSIPRSKLFPKPLSASVWRYPEVAAAWDEIAMRSWVGNASPPPYYQSGCLRQLLPPIDLLVRLQIAGSLDGAVLLMGTLPLLAGEFSFSDYFACELETPGGAKLSYECNLRRSGAA